jgi:hypothetical protein
MLRTISAFVETPFYVVAAALVIFVAVFWFALKHEEPAAAIHRFNRARHWGLRVQQGSPRT